MSFTLWPNTFTDFTGPYCTLPAAFINKLRTEMPEAVDGRGGTYAPTATLRFNGAFGITLVTLTIPNTGLTTWQSGSDAIWDSGSDALFRSGSGLVVEGSQIWASGSTAAALAGSAYAFAGTCLFAATNVTTVHASSVWNVGGTTNMVSGATTNVASGAIIAVTSGLIRIDAAGFLRVDGEANVYGTFYLRSGAVGTVSVGGELDIAGTLQINGAGICQAQSGGQIRAFSGANVRVDDGATCDIYGTQTIRSTGAVVYTSGCAASGTLADATTITRTNPTILSGNNAMIGFQDQTFSIAGLSGSVTVDVWKRTITFATGDPGNGNTRTWRLSPPTNNVQCMAWVRCAGIASTGLLVLKDDNTSTTIATFDNSTTSAQLVYYDGTQWVAV